MRARRAPFGCVVVAGASIRRDTVADRLDVVRGVGGRAVSVVAVASVADAQERPGMTPMRRAKVLV